MHSLKDLPTELPPGFEVAAIPPREDARDAFCSLKYRSIEDLPPGARVGNQQLAAASADESLAAGSSTFTPCAETWTRVCGNLKPAEYDAIILAAAGLNRLGKTGSIRQLLAADVMCPAAGQGALAIEIRKDDMAIRQHVAFLDDAAARAATTCERALLNKMGGGCQVPIGAFAEMIAGRLHLEAIVARPDGTRTLRESGEGDDPLKLGEAVGAALLSRGGDAILREVYGQIAAAPDQP